jgi:hypothetical protein
MAEENKFTNEINVWKMGCTWHDRTNPSIYEFIKDEEIVLGDKKFLRYSVGDLVMATEGFTVKAIALVMEEPKDVIGYPHYLILRDKYKVDNDDIVTFAKAGFYELKEGETFKYLVQRGGCKVNQQETKKRVIDLWIKRKARM